MKFILLFILASSVNAFGEAQNTKTANGRFQLIQLSSMRRDQYLLDTQTGKLWSSSCEVAGANGDCDYLIWTPQDVVGINISELDVLKKIKVRESAQQMKNKATNQ